MRAFPFTILLLAASCGGATPAGPTTSGPEPEASPWPEVAAAPVPELSSDARPLPNDVAARRRVWDARVAPDGSRVAFVVRAPTLDPEASPGGDEDQDGGWEVETQIWLVGREGGAPRQLTFGDGAAGSPRWSPDGSELAFLRGGQLHVLHMGGGEARTIEIDDDVEPRAFEWSPDGRSFAFTATRPTPEALREARFRSGGAQRYDREWEQVHLFVVGRDGGEARHVNQGTDSIDGFSWSPDGERFAVIVSETSDPYVGITQNAARVISARDGSVVAEIEDAPRPLGGVAFSPDGARVAYVAAEGGFVPNQLRVFDVEAGTSVEIAASLDPTIDGFVWSADSRSVVAHVLARTRSALHRIALDGAAERIAHGDRVLYGLHAEGDALVAVGSTATAPPDPVLVDLASGETTVLASINPQVSEWQLATVEVVRWTNDAGDELEGVYYRAPGAGDGPAPLMVMPHGGPDGVSMESWSDWNLYFAARGYSVFRPNYRGGIAYGQAFYAANRGRLGEIEFEDIESGVNALVEAGRADAERLYYGGWSWGGYLSTWTLGHTDRYRAHVVGAGVIDVNVQYATSDINHGVVADWEFRGRPWREPETFARSNPARFLQGATQPTLILHGMRDTRVAFVNGQMLYRALDDAGCEVDMYAYPRENHGFREPVHIAHMLTRWALWYQTH